MAGDWIKMRADLERDLLLDIVADRLHISFEEAFFKAYQLSAWVCRYGKFGKLAVDLEIVDAYLACAGFALAMLEVGYAEHVGGVLSVGGYSCPAPTRKSFGKRLRRKLMNRASCAACGSSDRLEIDHIVPVSRGGSNDMGNLQVLCFTCNRAKRDQPMDSFMATRRSA